MSRSTIDRAVGRRLRLIRLLRRITRGELAAVADVETEAIARYEAGVARPQPRAIAELADHLGVSLLWFFVGLGDDALEVRIADEIELASQTQDAKDMQFVVQFRELLARYAAAARMLDERRVLVAHARALLGRRMGQ
jgi:transcriptional regulator with XRE-family HTH domain